jgi:hypothetical protein
MFTVQKMAYGQKKKTEWATDPKLVILLILTKCKFYDHNSEGLTWSSERADTHFPASEHFFQREFVGALECDRGTHRNHGTCKNIHDAY